jgi:hypothetical protein
MRRAVLPSLFLVLLVAACRTADQPVPEGPDEPPPERTPAQVTAADFESLRWLEGFWRGTGGGVPAFYESYEFVDDSTIRGLNYSDSTLSQVSDSSRIVFSGGTIVSHGVNSSSPVTEIDSNRVRFETREAYRTFTWTRESNDAWSAHVTATILGDPQERTYQMMRIERPAR